jgi:LysM domain
MRPHLTRSLGAHLRETEDHSRLPFHPDCPICRRDRLAGSLEGEQLVSRRTQAAIAAGLLAFSTGGAPAAFGSPPDEVIEGTEEVISGGNRGSSVDFELGGETDQLPDVISPPPVEPPPVVEDEDAGPLEQEPVTNVSTPAVDREADDSTADPGPIAAEPAPSVSVPAPAHTTDPTEAQTQTVDPGPKPEAGERRRTPRPGAGEEAAPAQSRIAPTRSSDVVAVAPASAPVAPEPVQTTAAPAVTTRIVAHTSTGRAVKGDRFHTVQEGESLWSIAADVLGEDAGVARIAREVHRLWELNEDRIGTGQPDLLYAGTRLRLR